MPTPTTWTCQLSGMAVETTYHVTLEAGDHSGRVGYGSETIVIDTTAPQVSITSPVDGSLIEDNTPRLVFSVNGGIVEVLVDGSPVLKASGEELELLADGEHTVTVTSTDEAGNIGSDQSAFTVDANKAPLADAGPDQLVANGSHVTLSAVNSIEPDDVITSYTWTQVDGPPVTLLNDDTDRASFAAPASGDWSLAFELTVTDSFGESSTTNCLVNVSDTNSAPVAVAGDDASVFTGETVQLNGSASFDPDLDAISYLWQQVQGPVVSLNDATLANPQFTAITTGPEGASLIFELTVADTNGLRGRDQVVITIEETNMPPVAEACLDRTVEVGDEVTLSATHSSDSDGMIEHYLWHQLSGLPVTIADPGAALTSFSAPVISTYQKQFAFRVLIEDDGGLLDQDECMITILKLDQDNDNDVDGLDISQLAQDPALNNEVLQAFAARFGQ